MEVKFNVTKEERKALVAAISEITGWAAVYQGAPSFAFVVGSYTIDRYGTLIYDELMATEDVRGLLTGLTDRGFVLEGDIDEIAPVPDDLAICEGIPGESESGVTGSGEDEPSGSREHCDAVNTWTVDGSGSLVISMPISGFTASSFDNLEKLIAAKAWIIKKMTGADELPIRRDDEYLIFPWFKPNASEAEIDAYSRLIAGLCNVAKTKQRVTATERQLADGDNEKFKARCFLLSLNFIGKDYSQARKILLASMSGSGSHKSGNRKRSAAPSGAVVAGNGAGSVSRVGPDFAHKAADAAAPLKCGECAHHVYYREGQLLTNVGDIVDTTNRAPDSYTHYCLNAPSGYRKIKHATDWSGFETAPKWCPLCAGKGKATASQGVTNANDSDENPEVSGSGVREEGSGTDSADTGAANGISSDCLACGHSMSEPAVDAEESDRLFCVVKQTYVSDDGSCVEFNS